MRQVHQLLVLSVIMVFIAGCGTSGPVVQVTTVSDAGLEGLREDHLAKLEEIKEERKKESAGSSGLESVIEATPNYSVAEYRALFPDANDPSTQDYYVGGYDVLDIKVYEELELSREDVRVSADGYISFPFIGRVKVDGLTTSDIEKRISSQLAEGQYILDAHVSVTVTDFKSKQFLVLGAVKEPGSYPLQAKENLLDGISRAEGIDSKQGGKQGVIIRSLNPNTHKEKKIVIRIDIPDLLKGGDQISNLLLKNKDLLYIPKTEFYYVIGQVIKPGKYPYQERDITLVEAISTAGGFTPIAARNRTRILRMENGEEKIFEIKVDAITKAGKKLHDIGIRPGDVIVIPESFF